MKALILTNMVPPYRVPVFAELARRLGDGLLVVTMSARERNRSWTTEHAGQFRHHALAGSQMFVGSWDWALHLNVGVKRVLRSHQPDVVVVTGYDNLAYWRALLLGSASGAGVTAWFGSHRLSSRRTNPAAVFLRRQFVKRCDSFLSYGKLSAEYLYDLGAEPRRVVVGTNAVDSGRFSPDAPRRQAMRQVHGVEGRVVVLYSGQLIQRKGLDVVLEAFESVHGNAVLWVVGDGDKRAEWEKRASARLPNRVKFFGNVAYDAIPDLYRAADVLAVPSRLEVWGLVVNEGMAAGLPIVVSDRVGAGNDLVNGMGTGLSVSSEDSAAWAHAINSLVLDPSFRDQAGERGRALAAQFDTRTYAGDLFRAMTLAASGRAAGQTKAAASS